MVNIVVRVKKIIKVVQGYWQKHEVIIDPLIVYYITLLIGRYLIDIDNISIAIESAFAALFYMLVRITFLIINKNVTININNSGLSASEIKKILDKEGEPKREKIE